MNAKNPKDIRCDSGEYRVISTPRRPSKDKMAKAKKEANAKEAFLARCPCCKEGFYNHNVKGFKQTDENFISIQENGVCKICFPYVNWKVDVLTTYRKPTIGEITERFEKKDFNGLTKVESEVLLSEYESACEEIRYLGEQLDECAYSTPLGD